MHWWVVFGMMTGWAAENGRLSLEQRCSAESSSKLDLRVLRAVKTREDVRSRPLILPNGTVVVASVDGNVYFFTTQGRPVATFKTHAGFVGGAAQVSDDSVVVGGGDGKIYYLSAKGKLKSSVQTEGSVHSTPVVTPTGTVVIGSSDGNVYFLSSTGEKKAQFKIDTPIPTTPAVLNDGTVVVTSPKGYLYFLNPDASLKNKIKLGEGALSSPAVAADGTVVVGANGGEVLFIRPDGSKRAVFKSQSEGFGNPAIGADGTVVIGGLDHQAYFLSLDGVLKGTLVTGTKISGNDNGLKGKAGASGRFAGQPIWMDSNTVVSGSNDDILHFASPDGREIGQLGPLAKKLDEGQAALTRAAIAKDGTLVVGSADSHVYFIQTRKPSSPSCSAKAQ